MGHVGVALLLLIVFTTVGCQRQTQRGVDESARIAELQAKVNTLEARFDQLDKSNVQQIVDIYNLKAKTDGIANLDPASSDGYSMMGTSIGPLLLNLERVDSLADGSQITLSIGNPHAVSLMGIPLKVRYGTRYKEGGAYTSWEASLQQKEVSIPTTIYSGSWTPVKFSLPGVKPDQLGHRAITGDVNRVSLTPR